MPLVGSINLSIQASLTSALDLSTARDPLAYTLAQAISDGAGADQSNQCWHDTRTLVASANDDLDLAGVLVNAFGATVTFARVKFLFVRNKTTSGAPITVGPAPAQGVANFLGTSDRLPIGAWMCMGLFDATGWAITAGTADKIRIGNTSGSLTATYDIIVVGAIT
jgi:hypothetical protein